MGSDMCRRRLQTLISLFTKFQSEPKEVKGRKITKWFRIGEDIFEELHEVGLSVKWQFSDIKSHREAATICNLITNNKTWLECFISLYPSFRINLDLVGSADNICKVRTGVEVLLKGFAGIDSSFDKVLAELKEGGEVDEFDRCLKIWVETGHRPNFAQKHTGLQASHWWWF